MNLLAIKEVVSLMAQGEETSAADRHILHNQFEQLQGPAWSCVYGLPGF